jgi:ABC-type multidrug transport system ATPase subunit
VNGNSVQSIQSIKHRTGYVMQFDVLYPDLSPREHLVYSARMSGHPNPEKKADYMCEVLGIESCKNMRVGDDLRRGISGGERKRTSIGLELINDPSLLFLDEPTTGLDSKSALNLASLLRSLADNGRTVISTIHSPSSELLMKFDNVLCVCKGEVVYYGSPSNITSHFTDIGFPAPLMTNPADHLMRIIHEDDIRINTYNQGEVLGDDAVDRLFKKRIDLFCSACKRTTPQLTVTKDQPTSFEQVSKIESNISSIANFFTVLGRIYLVYFRNPRSWRTKLIQSIALTVITYILYGNTMDYKQNTLKAISDKTGLLSLVSGAQVFFSIFFGLYTYVPVLPIFRRENQSKLYGPTTFYLTHSLYETPFHLILVTLYVLSILWLVDLRRDSFMPVLKLVILLFVTRFCGTGISDLQGMAFRKIELIMQTFSPTVAPLYLVSGVVAKIKAIPVHMMIYSYLSPFRFALQAAVEIEFTPDVVEDYIRNCRLFISGCGDVDNAACYKDFSTLPLSVPRPPVCNPRLNLDFFEDTYLMNIMILIILGVILRLLALVATFHFVREPNMKNSPLPSANYLMTEETPRTTEMQALVWPEIINKKTRNEEEVKASQ